MRTRANSSYRFGGPSTGASRYLLTTRRMYDARSFCVRFSTKSYNSKRLNALFSDPLPSSYPNVRRRRLLRNRGLLLGDLVNPSFPPQSARSPYPPRLPVYTEVRLKMTVSECAREERLVPQASQPYPPAMICLEYRSITSFRYPTLHSQVSRRRNHSSQSRCLLGVSQGPLSYQAASKLVILLPHPHS